MADLLSFTILCLSMIDLLYNYYFVHPQYQDQAIDISNIEQFIKFFLLSFP